MGKNNKTISMKSSFTEGRAMRIQMDAQPNEHYTPSVLFCKGSCAVLIKTTSKRRTLLIRVAKHSKLPISLFSSNDFFQALCRVGNAVRIGNV